MDRKQIGVYAGKVWQLLSNNEKWGWLSRENKIEFDQCDEELYVYLCVNVYIG